MQTIKSEIIIDGDTVIVNGEVFVKQQVAEPKEVHPFLRDVPEESEAAYALASSQVGPVEQVFQCEIDRGTVSLNRDYLEELDRRRVAETALKRWIGENGIPVASEEQMADVNMEKISFEFDYESKTIAPYWWTYAQPVGDIHLLSRTDFKKVRDNCDALIRKAFGWPVTGDSK